MTAGKEQRGGIIFKFLLLCCFAVFLCALYLARHPLMRVAGRVLVLDDSPRASDAIVMLGDDNYNGDRATRAAELLKAGWAPRVVASGRYLRPYISIADLEQHDLTNRGAPASAIVRFPNRARNTREECTALSQLLAERGWKHVLLVTSSYHTRRAGYICSRLLPSGTELHVVAAPDSQFNPDDWWQSRQGEKIFFHEVVGFVAAAWELRHRSVQTTE
ncbi:MAG TPA: YdcF family protein [Candidatus Acidoferrales bacterium]|nr:YdcF family protein [Candidatus Acidoferrales bacterium]